MMQHAEKISFYFFILLITTFPVSVTLSQAAAVFSILFLIIGSFKNKHYLNGFKIPAIISIFLLYFSFLIPLLLQNKFSLNSIFKSEFADIWMAFILPISWFHGKNTVREKIITKAIFISFTILIFTGFISILTPFRLARYIQDGFTVIPGVRLQHFAGNIAGFNTYLPIGLMNTHLTYGGLLGLTIPGMTLYALQNWKNFALMIRTYFIIMLPIAITVLFYNQSRSVWMGVAFTFILYFFQFIKRLKLYLKQFNKLLFSVIFLLTILSLLLFKNNWLMQRAITEAFKKNTTENQRYFIYKFSTALITENFPSGTGAGLFTSGLSEKMESEIKPHEYLWYEINIVPKQHAHNDFLHFTAVGGLPSILLFLFFWYSLIRNFGHLLFIGIFSLFIAGFFQSYLLDDEVVLPFYLFAGLYLSKINKQEKIFKFRFLIFLLLPVGLYLLYMKNLINVPLAGIYQRKIKSELVNYVPAIRKSIFPQIDPLNIQQPIPITLGDIGYRMEGCLDHRYGSPPLVRKKPYSMILFIANDNKNPPTKVAIKVFAREAFDQDKYYKVHQSKFLFQETFNLKNGINRISFNDLKTPIQSKKNSIGELTNPLFSPSMETAIPAVLFRDFEFYYSGFKEKEEFFYLPFLFFGDLCDI